LSEGRPGVEQGLNAGDEAADILVAITQSYGDSAPDVSAADTVSEADALPLDEVKKSPPEIEQLPVEEPPVKEPEVAQEVQIKVSVQPQLETPQDISEYAILADDADEEIVEIFIEEAVEVLGELHTYLPQWEANNDDEEALAIVRRSFHTLKGSGRLLGANLIGEFSWKFENMLNRIIDNKISVSEPLLHALDESLAVLPQLIEQLKGNREPIDNIAQLMASADALAEGRAVDVVELEAAETVETVEPEAAVESVDLVETIDIEASEPIEAVTDDDIISMEDAAEEVIAIDLPAEDTDDGLEEIVFEDEVPEALELVVDDIVDETSVDETSEVLTALDTEESEISKLSDDSETADEIITFDTDELADDTLEFELTDTDVEKEETGEELIELSAEDVVDEGPVDLPDDIAELDEYEVEIDEGS
ncbi:MAG: Hpt domain-containing protein, partial [Candidatus Fermentibacteria bacterium]